MGENPPLFLSIPSRPIPSRSLALGRQSEGRRSHSRFSRSSSIIGSALAKSKKSRRHTFALLRHFFRGARSESSRELSLSPNLAEQCMIALLRSFVRPFVLSLPVCVRPLARSLARWRTCKALITSTRRSRVSLCCFRQCSAPPLRLQSRWSPTEACTIGRVSLCRFL